ncbi:MAG: Rrf2 family transcriptional regulator [Acidimicrobiales bacterium]|nr:Rrf2 family transcriptional regulator [Acidimicrobiales bacterium]
MRLALTKRSGDAIRILLYLASLPPGQKQTSSQIAEASSISAGNIPMLVAALSRAGILECTRGPGGGCALARDASQVNIAQAVIAVEGSLGAERCAIDDVGCHERAYPCGIHHSWTAVLRALTGELTGLSLADALTRHEVNRSGTWAGSAEQGR